MICKAFFALCTIVFLGMPISSNAQNALDVHNGNGLMPMCNSRDSFERGMCLGYILGFVVSGFGVYCLPSGVNDGQIKDVVVEYLRQNPGVRHQASGIIIVQSLRNAFPCPPARR